MYLVIKITSTGGHSRSTNTTIHRFTDKKALEDFLLKEPNTASLEVYEAKKLEVALNVVITGQEKCSEHDWKMVWSDYCSWRKECTKCGHSETGNY